MNVQSPARVEIHASNQKTPLELSLSDKDKKTWETTAFASQFDVAAAPLAKPLTYTINLGLALLSSWSGVMLKSFLERITWGALPNFI